MKGVLGIVVVGICIGIIAQCVEGKIAPHEELANFQRCYDKEKNECFGVCTANNEDDPKNFKGWDWLSTKLLGYKVNKKREYTPCQDRCIQASHHSCTVKNWEMGGERTFKMFGRYPMPRILIFEEFFAMIFCAILAAVNGWMLYNYYHTTRHAWESGAYGFEKFYIVYYATWVVSFSCAVLFHTKDTPLTEKLDYFTAVMSVMYGMYISTIRIFWIQKTKTRLLIGLPFILYAIYHIYYMTFVSFDYGYNQTVVVVIGIVHSFMWLGWVYKNKNECPHYKINLLAQVTMWSLAMLELFDFAPIFGLIDAHALWHFFQTPVSLVWNRFIVQDALHFIKKRKNP